MNNVFKRVMKKKVESGKTWDEIAKEAKIRIGSWMTGIPTSKPTDKELRAIAPVLKTTYEWLKYGDEKK
jgi:hypothetical protein